MSLEELRISLVNDLDAADTPGKFMAMQLRLAKEIKQAEAQKNPEMDEHKHKLRLLGDALAWKALDRHTIRELSRDRLRAAHLTSQGEDFDFVLSVAEASAKRGDLPLVCDLTHLLAVGDLLVLNSSGIVIFECKNRTIPLRAPTGRQARQESRAREASHYLETGFVEKEGSENRLSLDLDEPPHEHAALRYCVEKAYSDPIGGAGLVKIGERDFILAFRVGQRDIGELLNPLSKDLKTTGWRLGYSQGFSGAIWYPSPFRSNPFILPLSVQQRCDLVDGDLIIMRIVDVANFDYSGEVEGLHVEFRVSSKGDVLKFETSVDGESVELSNRFIEQVFWDFKDLVKMRALVAEMAAKTTKVSRALQTEGADISQHASPTVRANHAFVFRPQDPGGAPLVRLSEEQLKCLGVDTSAITDDLFVPVEGAPNVTVGPPMIIELVEGRPTIRPVRDGEISPGKAEEMIGFNYPEKASLPEEGSEVVDT
ncbi:hypothetical protein [Streptomyces sp. PRh5]|uniref:hypothetical protein n=1 Tax=Streptomyces sp. PRh5 TaxID=1158056 RepID=UPI0012FF2866|nr:hypothetical protein [Streptomyces sp. PRh5]